MDTMEYKQVDEYNQQGKTLYAAGKYEEAVEMFKKAEKEDPMCIDTYINMTEMFIFQQEFDKAKAAIEKVFYVDKNNGLAYFHLGNISYMTKNFEEARTNYSKAVSLGYNNYRVYYHLGLIYEELADVENALSMYKKTNRVEKYFSNARLRMIVLLITQSRFEEALRVADELIELRPEIFEGYHYKFVTLAGLERYEEAKKVIDVALGIYPDDLGFRYDQVKYLEHVKDFDEALNVIDKYFVGNEEVKRKIDKEKAKILFTLQRLDEARALFTEIVNTEYDEEMCYYLMILESGYGDYDKVLDCCKKIIDKASKNNFYYSAMYYEAACLKKMGKAEEAKAKYESAQKIFRFACSEQQGNMALYLFRALCYREAKNYDKAFDMVNYIDTLTNGTEAEAIYVRSKLYEDINELDKAKAEKEKAFALNPNLAEILM